MTDPSEQWEAAPELFFRYAREVNETARSALRLDTEDASALQAKISIGLSLQAAELAGKGILILLGMARDEVRREHSKHNVLKLLRAADSAWKANTDPSVVALGSFLEWAPVIKGVEFGNSIEEYMENHFAQGAKAEPRNYFYPDHERFTGPRPIQAVYLMVEYIIGWAERLERIVNKKP